MRDLEDRESGKLIEKAFEARLKAVAPFSRFLVGAVLEARDGSLFTGCNIENASYGLTICAERVAIFKAVSEGHRHFRQICVAADSVVPTPPCGACRQILWELCGDIPVILVNLEKRTSIFSVADLLPHPFDADHLKENHD